MSPKRNQGGWNPGKNGPRKPLVKNSPHSDVKTYYLTPEELEKYKDIKPPIAEKNIRTTAPRRVRDNKKYRGQL